MAEGILLEETTSSQPSVGRLPISHRGSFIKQFSGLDEGSTIVCFRFWELVVAAGCPFRCSYCFLQATPSYVFGRYPLQGAIFENWKDMLHEVEAWLDHPIPRLLLIGELQDGLAFDGAYKRLCGESLSEMLVPLFRRQKRHRLVFLTKSTCIQYLRRIEPTDRVVLSWSVNAESVGRQWEVGAPLPSKRLAAAKEMKEFGWPIRLRLDPMVPFDGWKDGYGTVIDKINEVGPEMVTIGALRASSTLKAHARRNGRDSSIFDLLDKKDPSGFKYRLPFETQVEMFRFAAERLDKDKIEVALCKEDKSVWDAVGLAFNGCHCLFGESDEVVLERQEIRDIIMKRRRSLKGGSGNAK